MIIQLEEKHLEDIALTHLLTWQKAFKGILSENLLNRLDKNEFLYSWQQVIKNKERNNYVALSDEEKAIGFISFGPYNNDKNNKCAEIYGIYVNPDYWRRGYAKSLMKKAISELEISKHFSGIFLWTMTKNVGARSFYEKVGFKSDGTSRVAERNGERFDECRYFYDLPL
jgi:RimJ/RimL family protein N-acetyltransferase